VKYLAMAGCCPVEKLIEAAQVRNIAYLPDIALDVGRNITAQPEVAPIGVNGGNRIAAVP